MAFQVGTRVDPKLGALDFSGFTNAANIQAKALANLGKSIGEGFEKYQENKKITGAALAELEVYRDIDPESYNSLKESDNKVGKALRNIDEGNVNRNDAVLAVGALKLANSAKDAKIARDLKELEYKEENIKQKQNAANAKALDNVIISNTKEDGGIDLSNLLPAYLEEGGQDLNTIKTLQSIGKPGEKSDTAKIRDYQFLVPLVGEKRAMEIVFVRRTELEKLIEQIEEGTFDLNTGTTPDGNNNEFPNFSIVTDE